MIPYLIALLILIVGSSVEATEYFAGPSGSGSTCSAGSPCTIVTGLGKLTAGDTLTLQNGTYQGSTQMLNIGDNYPGKSGTAGGSSTCGRSAVACTPITVRAENEGQVFIDGQFSTYPFWMSGNDYWKFSGFDVGNAGSNGLNSILEISTSDNNTFQRICLSNVGPMTNDATADTFLGDGFRVEFSSGNLFEDICSFGTAGNNWIDKDNATNNTFRRIWLRWEGHPFYTGFDGGANNSDCGGPPAQLGYGANQTSIIENVITVYQPDQVTSSNSCWDDATPGSTGLGGALIRDRTYSGDSGYHIRGWISYGQNTTHHALYTGGNGAWFNQAGGTDNGGGFAIDVQDMFIDALSLTSTAVGPIGLGCNAGGDCSDMIVNRITSLRGTASSVYSRSGEYATFTNINECTTAAACPNFYTGTVSSTLGARNCFRYVDGTLTSTPLWPWPMDDRIKAALARAKAAGLGGTDLLGSAGSGYAAGTVTSEIVSRYGSIPTACLTGSSFTPSFPVASDFPSVTVRDDFDRVDAATLGTGWTEILSDTFDLVSNAASAAPTGSAGAFARAIYSDTKLQTSHEVYATWDTIAVNGATTTFLSFAGTDLTANNQYRVRVTQSSSANTMVRVTRVDGAGTETTILSDVDLGIAAVDGNSFGVRVSGTTISVYWKWTDGIWYRVGEFTDSNLSTLPSTGVYGGIAGEKGTVINNFGAGPFVDQPEQSPPSLPLNTNRGRFGTTFPGVR